MEPQSQQEAFVLYLAGPMTGWPDNNCPAFNAAAREFESLGFEVINPADLDQDLPYEQLIRRGLQDMRRAQGVALLPGWPTSKGARGERAVALEWGLPVYAAHIWLHFRPLTPGWEPPKSLGNAGHSAGLAAKFAV